MSGTNGQHELLDDDWAAWEEPEEWVDQGKEYDATRDAADQDNRNWDKEHGQGSMAFAISPAMEMTSDHVMRHREMAAFEIEGDLARTHGVTPQAKANAHEQTGSLFHDLGHGR